jgi:hypothetical protein
MTFATVLIIVIGILAWVLRPGKRPTNPRRITILATVIPLVGVVLAAVIFQLLHNAAGKAGVSDISNIIFIAGLGLIGAAILALAGLAIARKGEAVKGMGFGLCIAVALSTANFALLEGLANV